MLVEADDLGDTERRVEDDARAGAASRATDRDAFAPDLVVGREAGRAALDEAGSEDSRQRLATIDRAESRDTGCLRGAIVEREGQGGAREVRGSSLATLRDGADVNQRVATGIVTSRRVRVDVLVVADQHVVEQDLCREVAGERQRRRAGVRNVD